MDKIVSAIVTTHNRPDDCINAINSVVNQTYKNIQIIVVDDASDVKSMEWLKSEIEKLSLPIIYHYIQPADSKGGNYARNLGVKLSQGDYVAFLDDDDLWIENKIEQQLELLTNHPKCKVVCCGRIFQYDQSNQQPQKADEIVFGDLSQRIFYSMPYTTSSFFIERKYFEEIGMFDEELRYWQDYELLIRLTQGSEILVPDSLLLIYNVNLSDKKRITNNVDGWFEAVQYINQKHSDLIQKLPETVKKKREAMIAQDAAKRLDRVGDKVGKRKYLKVAFQNERTLKNFVKYIFNISKIRG